MGRVHVAREAALSLRLQPVALGVRREAREVAVITVAALYVDPEGPYPALRKVECWDLARDARGYPGPHPVVAHPPCSRWTNLARANYARYGGAHNRPGNDGRCFEKALASVRQYGGVLEHPAGSHAWAKYFLDRPIGLGWELCRSIVGTPRSEWVCEVWQSAYGHKARKRTWVLYVGAQVPLELRWARRPGTHQVGWFDRKKPSLGKREASLTPPEFARALVRLARHSVPKGYGASMLGKERAA